MRELCKRFFTSVFSFCKIKGYYQWKYKFYRLCVWNPAFGLLQIGRKLENVNSNDVIIFRPDVIVKYFWYFFVSLVNLSYWSKFHDNIINCSGVMTISFNKGLTRNPEMGNTPVWISRYWDGQGIPNLTRTSLIKCYHCWFITAKPTWGGVKFTSPPAHLPHPTQIRKMPIKKNNE